MEPGAQRKMMYSLRWLLSPLWTKGVNENEWFILWLLLCRAEVRPAFENLFALQTNEQTNRDWTNSNYWTFRFLCLFVWVFCFVWFVSPKRFLILGYKPMVWNLRWFNGFSWVQIIIVFFPVILDQVLWCETCGSIGLDFFSHARPPIGLYWKYFVAACSNTSDGEFLFWCTGLKGQG